jgi:hypothetical protein
LNDSFGETRKSIGISPDKRVVEIYASLTTGTWTLVVTQPGELSCLMRSGENYTDATVRIVYK